MAWFKVDDRLWAHPTDSYGRTERGRRARKWKATQR